MDVETLWMIAAMDRAGWPATAIAQHFALSPPTIYGAIRRCSTWNPALLPEAPPPPPRWDRRQKLTADQRGEIAATYATGGRVEDLAVAYRVSASTIRGVCRMAKAEQRRTEQIPSEGAPSASIKPFSPPPTTPATTPAAAPIVPAVLTTPTEPPPPLPPPDPEREAQPEPSTTPPNLTRILSGLQPLEPVPMPVPAPTPIPTEAHLPIEGDE